MIAKANDRQRAAPVIDCKLEIDCDATSSPELGVRLRASPIGKGPAIYAIRETAISALSLTPSRVCGAGMSATCDRVRQIPLGVNYFTPLLRARVHVRARMKHSPIFGTRYPGAGRFFTIRRSRATTAAASNLPPKPVHAIYSCQVSVTAAVFMSYGMDLPRKISESHRVRGPHSQWPI